MNWDRVRENWNQFRYRIREKWGRLTEDELDGIQGRKDQLVGKIHERYGIMRDQDERDLDTFVDEHDETRPIGWY